MKRNSLSTTSLPLPNLIGIVSLEKLYRLTWFLNNTLDISLCLSEHKFRIHSKNNESELDFYHASDLEFDYFFFENILNDIPLITKYKKINYWLLIRPRGYKADYKEIETKLNVPDVIIGSFRITDEKEIRKLMNTLFGDE